VSRNERRRSGVGLPSSGELGDAVVSSPAVDGRSLDGARRDSNARRPSLLGLPQGGMTGSGRTSGARQASHSVLDGIIKWVPKARRNIPSSQLLEIARTTLRCVEAKDLTLDIMFKTAPPGANNTTVSPAVGVVGSGRTGSGLEIINSGSVKETFGTSANAGARTDAGVNAGPDPLKFTIGATNGIVSAGKNMALDANASSDTTPPAGTAVQSLGARQPKQDPFSLSRPVAPGESIDFFVSHSWHDDAQIKHRQVRLLVEAFKRRHGREPTFWFDKTCIDQANIADGLKVLPINVMACNKMLILCGPTYADRLWCVWELCTLFSFMRQDLAMERVVLVPMNSADCDVMKKLANFTIANAHCYDPNEENRLRKVISAVGEARFVKQVRELATAMANNADTSFKMRNSSHIFDQRSMGNNVVVQSMSSMTTSLTQVYSAGQQSMAAPLKMAGGYFGKSSSRDLAYLKKSSLASSKGSSRGASFSNASEGGEGSSVKEVEE